jgi:hypothetical protein
VVNNVYGGGWVALGGLSLPRPNHHHRYSRPTTTQALQSFFVTIM